jgi:hypothetical protein
VNAIAFSPNALILLGTGLLLGAAGPASPSAGSSKSERPLVVEVDKRDTLFVGEPYFVPNVPVTIDRKGSGTGPEPRCRPHRPWPQVERKLGKAKTSGRARGLLVHSGVRTSSSL